MSKIKKVFHMKTQAKTFLTGWIDAIVWTVAFLATWTSIDPTQAATITAGDLIASVNEFTGSVTAPTYIAEYTTTGTRVQILANVPEPGGTSPTTDEARY